MKKPIFFLMLIAFFTQGCKKDPLVCEQPFYGNPAAKIIGKWDVDRYNRTYSSTAGWQNTLLFSEEVEFFNNQKGLINFDMSRLVEFEWYYNEDSTYVYTFFHNQGTDSQLWNFKFKVKEDSLTHQLWEHKEYYGPNIDQCKIQIWDMTKQ